MNMYPRALCNWVSAVFLFWAERPTLLIRDTETVLHFDIANRVHLLLVTNGRNERFEVRFLPSRRILVLVDLKISPFFNSSRLEFTFVSLCKLNLKECIRYRGCSKIFKRQSKYVKLTREIVDWDFVVKLYQVIL